MPDWLSSLLQSVSRVTEASISGYGSWLNGMICTEFGCWYKNNPQNTGRACVLLSISWGCPRGLALTGEISPEHPVLHLFRDSQLSQAWSEANLTAAPSSADTLFLKAQMLVSFWVPRRLTHEPYRSSSNLLLNFTGNVLVAAQRKTYLSVHDWLSVMPLWLRQNMPNYIILHD